MIGKRKLDRGQPQLRLGDLEREAGGNLAAPQHHPGEFQGRRSLVSHPGYAERIYLDQICRCAGLSKSTLLRAFAKSKGVTPYSYLENIRIGKAKKLLEQGVPPIEAALQTGFSDQSHFTNYFNRFIGLAPGIYRDIFLDKDMEERPHER